MVLHICLNYLFRLPKLYQILIMYFKVLAVAHNIAGLLCVLSTSSFKSPLKPFGCLDPQLSQQNFSWYTLAF